MFIIAGIILITIWEAHEKTCAANAKNARNLRKPGKVTTETVSVSSSAEESSSEQEEGRRGRKRGGKAKQKRKRYTLVRRSCMASDCN